MQGNANKDCDFFIIIWYPSISHKCVKVASLSADCISAFQTLLTSNDNVFPQFPSQCAALSAAAARPYRAKFVTRSLPGLVTDNEIVRTQTESKDKILATQGTMFLTRCCLAVAAVFVLQLESHDTTLDNKQ